MSRKIKAAIIGAGPIGTDLTIRILRRSTRIDMGAHRPHHRLARGAGKIVIDLTPAAIGPHAVPVVNTEAHLVQTHLAGRSGYHAIRRADDRRAAGAADAGGGRVT